MTSVVDASGISVTQIQNGDGVEICKFTHRDVNADVRDFYHIRRVIGSEYQDGLPIEGDVFLDLYVDSTLISDPPIKMVSGRAEWLLGVFLRLPKSMWEQLRT